MNNILITADLHFNNDERFPVFNLKENECPSCVLKFFKDKTKIIPHLSVETDPNKKVTITIAGEEEIDVREDLTLEQKNQYKKQIKNDIEFYLKNAN